MKTLTTTKDFRAKCQLWNIDREEADDYLKAARSDAARDRREMGVEAGSDQAAQIWSDALNDALSRLDPNEESAAEKARSRIADEHRAKVQALRDQRSRVKAHIQPLLDAGATEAEIDKAVYAFDEDASYPGVAAELIAGTYQTQDFGSLELNTTHGRK